MLAWAFLIFARYSGKQSQEPQRGYENEFELTPFSNDVHTLPPADIAMRRREEQTKSLADNIADAMDDAHRLHDYVCPKLLKEGDSAGHSYCPDSAKLATAPEAVRIRPGTRLLMFGSSHINSMGLVLVGALRHEGVMTRHTVNGVPQVPECSSSSSSAPVWRTGKWQHSRPRSAQTQEPPI